MVVRGLVLVRWIRDRRLVDFLVAVVFAWVILILFGHEGRSARQFRTRTSRGCNGPGRGSWDGPEARRPGRARPCERAGAGPAATAPGRSADPDPHDPRQGRSRRPLCTPAFVGPSPGRGGPPALPRGEGRDRPPDRERLLLRLRVSRADQRGRSAA